MLMDSLNPSHAKEVVGCCALATPQQAEQAVRAAAAAFPGWRDTEPARDTICFALPNASRTPLRVVGMGSPRMRQALARGRPSLPLKPSTFASTTPARCCVWQSRNAEICRVKITNISMSRGVAVIIAPWNFPLAILCGMATAALVTGNTIILKPAEQSTIIAAKFMEVLRSVDLPAGVVAIYRVSVKKLGRHWSIIPMWR